MKKSSLTVARLFQEATAHHQAGRLTQAEKLYRTILEQDGKHADSLHLLGLIYQQQGRPDLSARVIGEAIVINCSFAAYYSNFGLALKALSRPEQAMAAYRRALRLEPDFPEAYSNLGNGLRDKGNLADALNSFKLALLLRPDLPEALYNLGVLFQGGGQTDQAILQYRHALASQPGHIGSSYNLGLALQGLGRLVEAQSCYRHVIGVRPDHPQAISNLGAALQKLGDTQEAVSCYRRALTLRPNLPEALSNLGNIRKDQGQKAEAERCYIRALAITPDNVEFLSNFGNLLRDQSRLSKAVARFRQALCIKPDHPETLSNHGTALQEQGKLDDALRNFQRSLFVKPDYNEAHQNLIFLNLYRSEANLPEIAAASARWNRILAEPLNKFRNSHNRPPQAPAVRPRIGFVSGDFRVHAVGSLIIPAIEGLSRAGFHITCYSNNALADPMTNRFRQAAARWRAISGMPDELVEEQIRSDEIDILIDLSGHSGHNRLLLFARKPAALQVAWAVGYPATTGLGAMDYLIADRHQVPPEADRYYSEKIVRLPDSYICFEPPPDAPPPGNLPASANGRVTFGSFNVLKKITPQTIATWCAILHRLPTSVLLMKSLALDCAETVNFVKDGFAIHGIDADRVRYIGRTSPAEHRKLMDLADIALDPFPYTGGMTTLEALWMGLPVITKPGPTFSSRHSFGYLSTIGLSDLIARDSDHYVELAVECASDLGRLAKFRNEIRQIIRQSALSDHDRFTGHFASALMTMWHNWTINHTIEAFDVTAADDRGSREP